MRSSNETILTSLWFDRGTARPEWLLAFEAYGHAMACASALELQLSLYLCKHRLLLHNKGDVISPNDFLSHAQTLRQMTLPKLIGAMRKKYHLSDELVEGLNAAKKARDVLAHNFWDTNLALLQSVEGVDIIVKSCTFDCWQFKALCDDLEREIGFDVMEYVNSMQAQSELAEREIGRIIQKYI